MIGKVLLKRMLFGLGFKFGFIPARHQNNRDAVCVLMVHGVMAKHAHSQWEPLRSQLSPSEFQRTLAILSCFYQFVDIEQAIQLIEGKQPAIQNALLITFDDGYRNNLDYALPICKQFSIKPLLFVTTGNVESGRPFKVDRLDYALQQNMGEVLSLEHQGRKYHFDATSRNALIKSYKVFRDTCKQEFRNDIEMGALFDALCEQLEQKSGLSLNAICDQDDWSAIVSWQQLREAVHSDSIDVASHTVEHWRVDCLPESELIIQLQQSKLQLEQNLGIECRYFCYPNGSYNKLSISTLRKLGYRAAFSTDVGLCRVKDDLMMLKRFNFPAQKSKSELLHLLNQ